MLVGREEKQLPLFVSLMEHVRDVRVNSLLAKKFM
jgi:hypothetical protein